MKHLYLQDPPSDATTASVLAWVSRLAESGSKNDSLWAVVDGALLGADGLDTLQRVYGEPLRAFDQSPVSDYDDYGLLLWSLDSMCEGDKLAALLDAVGHKPCVSFLRAGTERKPLQRVLSWLASAVTTDHLRLYLRIGDTRVLPSVLKHLKPEQRGCLQSEVREWVWPDRAGEPCEWHADPSFPAQAPVSTPTSSSIGQVSTSAAVQNGDGAKSHWSAAARATWKTDVKCST